ncbi:DUF2207 domain-containing protein [Microbacterium lacus]|uniref:DUF2207 domain-containing protein n=1 Tax=Microbacterium lacus TaxID=415217 RepID=UPI00384E9C71
MTGRFRGTLRKAIVALAAVAIPLILVACSVNVSFDADPAPPVSSDVNAFTFASLDVEYELSRAEDGTSRLRVVERFVADFPDYDQNRGMRRAIPDSYLGVPLHPELVSITDENGAERESETDSEDGYYSMTSRADDYVQGRQTYVFEYTLENVTRFFRNTRVDEFYWNVNGTEWQQPFGRVTARLSMDTDLADALTGDGFCYVGYEGSTDLCSFVMDAATGEIRAEAGAVLPYQTVTVAVAFEQGTFAEFDDSYLASPWGWLQGIAGLGVAGALTAAGVTRARRLRDEPGRPTIIAEYTPPPEIDALESAVLLNLPAKAIPAEVLEQAVVGSIRIIEGERRWFGGTKLIAELIDPSKADGDGIMLLEGLFPYGVPGEQYEFGRQDTRLSNAAQKILKAAASELDRRGLRRKVPGMARAWPVIISTLSTILVFILGFLALDNGVSPVLPLSLMAAAIIVEFIVIGMVSRKPLTAKGAEVRDHLEGLKIFIEWAEADRIRMLQSPAGAERVPVDSTDPREKLKLYEKLLPYAVVFGQEKEWAKQLAVLYGDGSPRWYAGSSGFNAAAFSSGISTLSASTASSSSTSGGSGGGGSAGGGGGGGGGGGV